MELWLHRQRAVAPGNGAKPLQASVPLTVEQGRGDQGEAPRAALGPPRAPRGDHPVSLHHSAEGAEPTVTEPRDGISWHAMTASRCKGLRQATRWEEAKTWYAVDVNIRTVRGGQRHSQKHLD